MVQSNTCPSLLSRRRWTATALFATATALLSPSVLAAFPDNPIKLIVPFPPGGAADTIGRQIAADMSKHLGQTVYVDNRPGASGSVGVTAVISAPADGYTILLAASSHVAADPVQEKLAYNPKRDLVPIAPLVAIPYVVVANPQFPPNNIRELIATAKAKPSQFNFASSGIGSPPHMASELLVAMGGFKATHIPYKGAVPALTDLVGGEVQFMSSDVNASLPFIQSGRLKALATTGKVRVGLLPDVPTVAESGIAGFDAEGWFAVFASSKIPKDVQEALVKAATAGARDPGFAKRMAALGGRVLDMPPVEFQKFIADETLKRSNLIKTNKIVLNGD